MKTLISNIEQWADERNLINGSTPDKQMLKLMEEFGELCGGIAKNKPDVIKDSIGDCVVVGIILTKQLKVISDFMKIEKVVESISEEFLKKHYEDETPTSILLDALHNIGALAIPIQCGWKIQPAYLDLFLINLIIISLQMNIDFKDCLQHAYDQIKDRKGKMIDGVFVKEEDL